MKRLTACFLAVPALLLLACQSPSGDGGTQAGPAAAQAASATVIIPVDGMT